MVHSDTDPLSVIGRWLTYLGILLALGVAVFHRVVIRGGPMPRAAVQALATLLFVSAAATVVVAGAAGLEAGSVPDYLLSGRNGLLQLARAAVAVIGGVALLLLPARLAAAVAAVTGLAGIVLLVSAGHASALATPVPTIGQVVHVAGAAVWIGGIVCLLVLAIRPAVLIDGPVPAMRSLVPRFSALALAVHRPCLTDRRVPVVRGDRRAARHRDGVRTHAASSRPARRSRRFRSEGSITWTAAV